MSPPLTEIAITPRPLWALRAGFANRLDAAASGCVETNAHVFRDGRRIAGTGGTGVDETSPDMSEDALALEWVRNYGAEFRWSPGMQWMINTGNFWESDAHLRRFDRARILCRSVSKQATPSEGKKVAAARTVSAVLSLAQSDPRVVVPVSAWDAESLVLNTPTGIVDLATGAIRPRLGAYVTQCTRVGPDYEADCPTWHRFLAQVFQGDGSLIDFMQRAMGYWLSGDRREQVLFFLYGLGANGKSTLIELVIWLAGSYSLKLPSSALMQSKHDRHPTEIAQLRGKRLAVSSELDDGQFFNESLVKELTGDDTMTARFMRADFFQFTQTQKHVVVGNYKPRLRGGDAAMARRMVLVPFNASFSAANRDGTMLDKLRAEGPAILAWIIKGTEIWLRDGLQIPAVVRDASADYLAEHDDLRMWIDECCEPLGETRAVDLYASFSDWKKARGEHAPSLTAWGSRLSSLPGIDKRRSGGIRYSGIRLASFEVRRLNEQQR